MDFFKKANNAWQWIGDRAKSVSKWVGDNKATIKSYADKVAQYAPTIGAGIGGAVGTVNPAIGGAIAGFGTGLGKAAEFVRDKVDSVDSTLKKGIGYYDKADDNIQRIKKGIDKTKLLKFS